MDLRVIIPTFRRTDQQHTFRGLPAEWKAQTTFVVDKTDAASLEHRYKATGCEVLVHPEEVKTIAQKRAWILRELRHGKIVMFDDDLRFAYRPNPAFTKLEGAQTGVVGNFLNELSLTLDSYVHAGWSARQGNNRLTSGFVYNTRMMYVLGYRRADVVEHCELGRIETREDMDVTLQLLRKGFPNAVMTNICADQAYNAPGGASMERTVESSNADAHKLAALHPGLVRITEKSYKASVPRLEVVCSWKEAYESSRT